MTKINYHIPVLKDQVISFLNCKGNGIYLDVTLGGGGYSEAILEMSDPDGLVIGIDRDEDAIKEAGARLEKYKDRFQAKRSKFSKANLVLKELGVKSVDGIVADLGISSYHVDKDERGFSFSKDAKLDMRMDQGEEISAYDLVNHGSEEDIANWIYKYGEERYSRRIARLIVKEREKSPVETTNELASIVERAVPRRGKEKIHPATRTFQALRIVVNEELTELEKLVGEAPEMLNPGGRFLVVSYHSLEDRIVKQAFLELEKRGNFKRITRKPIRPAEEEIANNRRARSARLRVLERV